MVCFLKAFDTKCINNQCYYSFLGKRVYENNKIDVPLIVSPNINNLNYNANHNI